MKGLDLLRLRDGIFTGISDVSFVQFASVCFVDEGFPCNDVLEFILDADGLHLLYFLVCFCFFLSKDLAVLTSTSRRRLVSLSLLVYDSLDPETLFLFSFFDSTRSLGNSLKLSNFVAFLVLELRLGFPTGLFTVISLFLQEEDFLPLLNLVVFCLPTDFDFVVVTNFATVSSCGSCSLLSAPSSLQSSCNLYADSKNRICEIHDYKYNMFDQLLWVLDF